MKQKKGETTSASNPPNYRSRPLASFRRSADLPPSPHGMFHGSRDDTRSIIAARSKRAITIWIWPLASRPSGASASRGSPRRSALVHGRRLRNDSALPIVARCDASGDTSTSTFGTIARRDVATRSTPGCSNGHSILISRTYSHVQIAPSRMRWLQTGIGPQSKFVLYKNYASQTTIPKKIDVNVN